jgi:hypothetical protein
MSEHPHAEVQQALARLDQYLRGQRSFDSFDLDGDLDVVLADHARLIAALTGAERRADGFLSSGDELSDQMTALAAQHAALVQASREAYDALMPIELDVYRHPPTQVERVKQAFLSLRALLSADPPERQP